MSSVIYGCSITKGNPLKQVYDFMKWQKGEETLFRVKKCSRSAVEQHTIFFTLLFNFMKHSAQFIFHYLTTNILSLHKTFQKKKNTNFTSDQYIIHMCNSEINLSTPDYHHHHRVHHNHHRLIYHHHTNCVRSKHIKCLGRQYNIIHSPRITSWSKNNQSAVRVKQFSFVDV